MYILLGWNGLWENKSDIPTYCKKQAVKAQMMVNKIHEAYPKAWVRIIGRRFRLLTEAQVPAMDQHCLIVMITA